MGQQLATGHVAGAPAFSEQVASIETKLRGMQHVNLQSRVADLEEEVFG